MRAMQAQQTRDGAQNATEVWSWSSTSSPVRTLRQRNRAMTRQRTRVWQWVRESPRPAPSTAAVASALLCRRRPRAVLSSCPPFVSAAMVQGAHAAEDEGGRDSSISEHGQVAPKCRCQPLPCSTPLSVRSRVVLVAPGQSREERRIWLSSRVHLGTQRWEYRSVDGEREGRAIADIADTYLP